MDLCVHLFFCQFFHAIAYKCMTVLCQYNYWFVLKNILYEFVIIKMEIYFLMSAYVLYISKTIVLCTNFTYPGFVD